MIRKAGSFLFAASVLFSGSALAANMQDLIGKQYTFLPLQAVELKNPMPFNIKISCKISTKDSYNTLQVYGLNKSVEVNGHTVNQGATVNVPVYDGMQMNLKAEGNAAVKITNIGKTNVGADCGIG